MLGLAHQAEAALQGQLPAGAEGAVDARVVAQTLIDTLGMLADKTAGRLDPDEFVQIHRSALIRRSQLAELTRSQVGGSEIKLRSGQRLPLGRVHGKAIQRSLRAAVD